MAFSLIFSMSICRSSKHFETFWLESLILIEKSKSDGRSLMNYNDTRLSSSLADSIGKHGSILTVSTILSRKSSRMSNRRFRIF
jgi:hypothetical protein